MKEKYNKYLKWVLYATVVFLGLNFLVSVLGTTFPYISGLVSFLGFFFPLILLWIIRNLKFNSGLDAVVWFGLWGILIYGYIALGSMAAFLSFKGFILSFIVGLTITNIISLVRMKKGKK